MATSSEKKRHPHTLISAGSLKRAPAAFSRERGVVKLTVVSRIVGFHAGMEDVGKRRPAEDLEAREIRGRIRKPGNKRWIEARFWTALTDEMTYPGMELLKLLWSQMET